MTARRFRPYAAYKDSGIEWLGAVPAHWEVKRLKVVAQIESGQSPPSDLVVEGTAGLPFLQGNADFGRLHPTPHETCDHAPKRARPGDILLSVRAPVGAMNVADREYGIGRGLAAIRPGEVFERRFSYHTLSATRGLLDVVATGSTYDAVSAADIGDLPATLPELAEQRAISAFLDRETARIDDLVAKKERLIELLQELRTALITLAVTKGLDPDVPTKNSGVEWLGPIPSHWEAKPIRTLAMTGLKTFTDGDWIETPFIRDEGIRLVQTGNIGVGAFKEQGFRFIDEETFRTFRCTEVRPGDVLICRLADPVGRACIAPDLGCRMITSVDVCILKPATDVHAPFVVYALSSLPYLSWLSGICRGGTRDRVSRSMLGAIHVQLPPLEEQRDIAEFLNRQSAQIDGLVTKVREAIERLGELRTALISAAVTGRIDVRESAPVLPDVVN